MSNGAWERDCSPSIVGRLLKAQGYSLRKNRKSIETPTGKPPDRKRRNRQFLYINRQRREYEARELPVISIDTKSREFIGQFYQDGLAWDQESIDVFDHDFPSMAKGVGIPHGIYDTLRNEGFISVGTSKDTSQFAVDSLRTWWLRIGHQAYPQANEILLLADCGGSNGYRTRLWKQQLQEQFCTPLGLTVRVCHYPPGASKWNPIEHRLFAFISRNWAARPLDSYQTMLNFIRTTSTNTVRSLSLSEPMACLTSSASSLSGISGKDSGAATQWPSPSGMLKTLRCRCRRRLSAPRQLRTVFAAIESSQVPRRLSARNDPRLRNARKNTS